MPFHELNGDTGAPARQAAILNTVLEQLIQLRGENESLHGLVMMLGVKAGITIEQMDEIRAARKERAIARVTADVLAQLRGHPSEGADPEHSLSG